MADFEKAVEFVLAHEGGYVNNPRDRGGETNWGISRRWLDAIGIFHQDLQTINREQAVELYREYFWEPYPFSSWPDDEQELATKLFDATVNMGPAPAMRCFQRALRACGQRQVIDDGVYGPVTMRAKAEVGGTEPALLAAFRSELAARYRVLAASDPSKRVFLTGWLRRAYS